MKHYNKSISLNKENPKTEVKNWKRINRWLEFIAFKEGGRVGSLNYNIVSDESLLKLNNEKLNHDYYTDIITFDLSDEEGTIEGDIYISSDRIKENAKKFHVKRMEEMRRVFAHGLLHLLGYSDKNKKEKLKMREKEDYYLSKYNKQFNKKQ